MTNIYSVNKDMEVKSTSSTYIDAGIKEDIFLTNVEYNTTTKGNEYLAFYFENKYGDKLSHTEWPVRPFKSIETLTAEEQEAFLQKVDNQKRRIGQIVTTFIPKDKYDFVSNSFKEYAENIVKLLKDNLHTIPVRLKIVYNKKNYTTLPNYWKYTFIERMDVPAEQSQIRPLSIDVFTKSTAAITSNSVAEDLGVFEAAKPIDPDAIPF